MAHELIPPENSDFSFLQGLVQDLARRKKIKEANIVARYMIEKFPERVIKHEDSNSVELPENTELINP